MSEIKNLQPQAVWKNFDLLTQVPRPSGHLEKVQKFLLDWAAEHKIEAFKDEAGNIIMYKPIWRICSCNFFINIYRYLYSS